MPTLNQLANGSSDPTQTVITTSNPVVEPLDGPTPVDAVFDRFCEEVYQQGKDSHLYRLLLALGGDAGAGFIKNQTYASRLQWEAEFLNFRVLDQIYSAQFRFQRLPNETYPSGLNPETDALTPDQWNAIEKADQSYRQRMMEFWVALRYGNSPMGLITMGQAGCGLQCELIENYKWVFDQMSDDPLGLEPMGTTNSVFEFMIVPRFLNSDIAANFEYEQRFPYTFLYNTASMPSIRPSLGGIAPTVEPIVSQNTETTLLPEYERNMIDLLDRLRPASTLGSVVVDERRYIEVPIEADSVAGSSTRMHVSRLVTGQAGVKWPPVDPSRAYFIEEGVENEAGYFYGSARELPIIFLSVDNVHAYTEKALDDPSYLTSEFFGGEQPPANVYKTEFTGFFSATTQALYPFLNGLSGDITFGATNAVAAQDTPLVLEAKAVA